ncbi:MAG: hypothetical protein V3S85_02510, partial [Nitrospirales bacterium]
GIAENQKGQHRNHPDYEGFHWGPLPFTQVETKGKLPLRVDRGGFGKMTRRKNTGPYEQTH